MRKLGVTFLWHSWPPVGGAREKFAGLSHDRRARVSGWSFGDKFLITHSLACVFRCVRVRVSA